jgi:hypothetical protein
LFGISTSLSVTGLIFMGFRQKGEPAKAARLHHRQIKVCWLAGSDALAFLLNQKPQPKLVKLGHGTGSHPQK